MSTRLSIKVIVGLVLIGLLGMPSCAKKESQGSGENIEETALFHPRSRAGRVEELISQLKVNDSGVRLKAAETLGEIGKPAIKPLLAALKVENQFVCLNIARALGKIGEPAIEPLLTALKDEKSLVRMGVARALGEIGDSRAVEPLIAVLKDKDKYVRHGVALALGDIGDSRAVEPLIAALKDRHKYVRAVAALSLGEIGDNRAVEPLLAALKDEDGDVRRGAASALGGIRDRRVVELLLAALKDRDKYVRAGAAGGLGKTGDNRAVEPLIVALKDEDSGTRSTAAEALGKIRDSRAVEPLIAALKDKDSYIRKQAAEALSNITGKDFGQDIEKWQEWWEEEGKLEKKLSTPISYEFEEATLKEIMRVFSRKTGIGMVIDEASINNVVEKQGKGELPKITLKLEAVPLKDALRQALQPLGLDYYKRKNIILVTTKNVSDALKLTIEPVNAAMEEYGVYIFRKNEPFKIKVTLKNGRGRDLNLLTPGMQNHYEKVFYFQVLDKDGNIIETEDRHVTMEHNETIGPEKIILRKGGKHTFYAYLNSKEYYGIEHHHYFTKPFTDRYYKLRGVYDTRGYKVPLNVPEITLYSNSIRIEVIK